MSIGNRIKVYAISISIENKLRRIEYNNPISYYLSFVNLMTTFWIVILHSLIM